MVAEGGWERAGRVGCEAEDEVGGDGARPGTEFGTDIEAEPDEAPDAAEAEFIGTESGGVAGGNAGHFGEVVHGAEFHVGGAWQLAHELELAGDTFASGNAGLSAASENFFDGIEGGVVDPFSEGEVEGVGGDRVVEGQHLKGFEDGKRNVGQ